MRPPRDPRARFALGVLAVMIGLGVVLAAIDRLSPAPKGPPSSSYATTPKGLAAYASLLDRYGHPVRRLRTPVADKAPRTDETLVVLDPNAVEPEEARAIARWVDQGGRLLAGGAGEPSWMNEVLGAEPPVSYGGGDTRHGTLMPVTETANVRTVESESGGGWDDVRGLLPVVGPAGSPLVVTTQRGEGSVVLLADTSPLSNGGIGRADNAALGLALAGGEGKPVAFLETVHGYGVSRGIGGLPTEVKWTLLGLVLTSLVAIWAAGRRFGPPEDPDTPLPPPRIEYVDALAGALVRAKPDKENRS